MFNYRLQAMLANLHIFYSFIRKGLRVRIYFVTLSIIASMGYPAFAECRKLVVSGDSEYPPFSWYDGTKLKGAAIEIVSEVLKELGVDFEVKYVGPFARMLEAAKLEGKIDIIAELKNTPERQEFLEFSSVPMFVNPMAVFVLKNSAIKYSQWSDLKNYRGGIVIGHKFGGEFDEYLQKNLKITEVRTMDINFDKLKNHRIDYFIISYYPALSQLIKNQQQDDFKALKPFVAQTENFVGWAKSSPCIGKLREFDKIMEKLKKSGKIDKIIQASLKELRKNSENN